MLNAGDGDYLLHSAEHYVVCGTVQPLQAVDYAEESTDTLTQVIHLDVVCRRPLQIFLACGHVAFVLSKRAHLLYNLSVALRSCSEQQRNVSADARQALSHRE